MHHKTRAALLGLAAVALIALPACEKREPQETQTKTDAPAAVPAEPKPPETGTAEQGALAAAAHLQPTEGNSVSGTVTFTQVTEGVEVVAEIQGLTPGQHGMHVHEIGDCSAPDASSAGGHFNPEGSPHGAPENPPAQRHAGDLGNIEADSEGNAQYRRVDQVMTMEGPNSIIGKAVVVHAGADDMTSQPAGDAGGRVACGVIEPKSR